MRQPSGNPVEEFEELRRLLLGREREQLGDLRDRISNKERRSQDVAGVLPQAVKRSRGRGDKLARALRPTVEGSIKESIETRPQTFVEALHPIIGTIVRKSIAKRFRRLLQSRTLVYRVEQVFLIHRETNRSLLHVTGDSATAKNSGSAPRMLSAIQDFVRDYFRTGETGGLNEFQVGELRVWIAPGRYAYLAAVIRGNPPRDLRMIFEETIESVYLLTGKALANFQGDPVIFEPFRPELEACLRTRYVSKRSLGRQIAAWTALGGGAAVLICALVLAVRSQLHWRDFVGRLKAEPGIVVTEARQGWFSPSQVTGLRDRSAADPTAIALAAGINPTKLRFHWKEFFAVDPAIVRKRFADRFQIPPGTDATITDGVLRLSGSAPYEWLEGVRREASQVPGIVSLADRELAVIHDPSLALKRFEEKFTFPKTVRIALVKDTVILSGKAPHAWLTRVRSEGNSVPGIGAVNEQGLLDLDHLTFKQSRSFIENAFVEFAPGKDDITTDGLLALSILQNEVRRCETAAEQLDEVIVLEINGYADSITDATKAVDLSQRRAQKVRNFLRSCGFDPARLRPVGMGAPSNAPPSDPDTPRQLESRVVFKVSSSRGLP